MKFIPNIRSWSTLALSPRKRDHDSKRKMVFRTSICQGGYMLVFRGGNFECAHPKWLDDRNIYHLMGTLLYGCLLSPSILANSLGVSKVFFFGLFQARNPIQAASQQGCHHIRYQATAIGNISFTHWWPTQRGIHVYLLNVLYFSIYIYTCLANLYSISYFTFQSD